MATTKSKIPAISLIISYILDWVVIIALAGAGAGLNVVRPQHRPFSLVSLENSYPFKDEQVPYWLAFLCALVIPAGLIVLIALFFIPGPRAMRSMNRSRIIRVKLWELEKGLAGLCLAAASAFFITQAMKNMFGKPRPNMFERSCMPDLNNVQKYVVGGYGQNIDPRWTMVTYEICTNTDQHVLDDGFRSFPSGHSSFSWSGLLYFSLFLASKFNVSFPHLPYQSNRDVIPAAHNSEQQEMIPLQDRQGGSESTKHSDGFSDPNATLASPSNSAHPFRIRHMAASPPNYFLIPVFLPIGVAIWICATRFADYYHFGFDIIFGSLIGILTAYFSFRWYHLPLSRGQGWAWGARSKGRAFGIGVGTEGWVGDEGWTNAQRQDAQYSQSERMA